VSFTDWALMISIITNALFLTVEVIRFFHRVQDDLREDDE
jgi:hypothetical protein